MDKRKGGMGRMKAEMVERCEDKTDCGERNKVNKTFTLQPLIVSKHYK